MATLKKVVPTLVLPEHTQVSPMGGAAVWGGISDALDAAADYVRPAAEEEMRRQGQQDGMDAGQGSGPNIQYSGGTDDGGITSLSLLREFEGFRETPYWDVNAYRTGYGSDTITTADGKVVKVKKGMRVSREDADRDLSRRVQNEFEPSTRRAVGDAAFSALSSGQRAALNSLAYNYGAGAWGDDLSGVAAAVRSGDPSRVSDEIRALGSHNDGVNRKRRNREAEIFLGGGAGASTPTTVAIMSNGQTAQLPESPYGGRLGAIYSAAAQTAYLGEVQNQAVEDLLEMSHRFTDNPEGFKDAAEVYINQVAEDAPGEYAAGVRSSLGNIATRRITGLLAEKQSNIKQRALNASQATIGRLTNDYASLLAAGDEEAATAAGAELQEALRVHERLPGSTWTPQQSAGVFADAQEMSDKIIAKQRKERSGAIQDDLEATIKAAKNGRHYANEGILTDPETFALQPELAREAQAYVEIRDVSKHLLQQPPSVFGSVVDQMEQEVMQEEWEQDFLDAAKAMHKHNVLAWKKDPISRAYEVMPEVNKPPQIDLPVDGDMEAFSASLGQRLTYARQLLAGGYTDDLIVLSEEERDQISALFDKELPPEVRAMAAGALHAGLGDASMKVFDALKVDKTTRFGGMMLASGADQVLVATALQGQMLIDTGAVKAPSTARFSEVAGADLVAAFDGVPGARNAQDEIVTFARALYASGNTADLTKTDEKAAMVSAVQQALGQGKTLNGEVTGGVQQVLGAKTLLPVGVSGAEADAVLRKALGTTHALEEGFMGAVTSIGKAILGGARDPDLFVSAWKQATSREGYEGSGPMWNGKPLDADMAGDNLRIVPFGGSMYRMEVSGYPVEDDRGNVFIFDLKKLMEAMR